MFELFEPTALKHFNEVVLPSIEGQLEADLWGVVERNKNSKGLSSALFKKRKEGIYHYKKLVNGHREYSLLLKKITERTGEVIAKEERKLSHLFSLFENAVFGHICIK